MYDVSMTHFTLFIVLPSQDICSLRNLPTGTTIKDVRNRLEMSAGLPCQTYKLISSNGQVLHEECRLNVGQNVWDGFILRVQLLDSWQPVYDAVTEEDVEWLLRNGAIDLNQVDEDDVDGFQVSEVVQERGTVALYLASWKGSEKTCHALLSAGVSPNGRTPFQRTAIFAAVAKDNDRVLEVLLNHGSKTSIKDYNGETALDVARRGFSRQCVNVMRSFQLRNGGTLTSPRSNRVSSAATRSRSPGSVSNISLQQYGGRYQREGNHSPLENREGTSRNSSNTAKLNGIVRPRSGVSSTSSTARRVKFHDEVLNARLNICNGSPATAEANHQYYSKPLLKNQHASTEKRPLTSRTPNASWLRVAVTSPNKSLELSNVVTWNDSQILDSEFLTIRSAFREGKVLMKPFSQVYAPKPEILNEALNEGIYSLEKSFSASNVHHINQRSTEDGESKLSMSSLRTDDYSPLAKDITSSMSDKDSRSVVSDPNLANSRINSASSCPGSLEKSRMPKLSARIVSSPNPDRYRKKKRIRKSLDDQKIAKIRIHLSEKRKQESAGSFKKAESFDQWLQQKRQQEINEQGSSDTDSGSDDDDDNDDERNDAAFDSWLKKVRERPKSRTSHSGSTRFDPKKPQSIQGLVGIASSPVRQPMGKAEASTYMTAFKEWKSRRASNMDGCKPLDAEEAKRQLEAKRQQLLAMAITFDEWMAHSEERKLMLEMILKADDQKLDEIKRINFAKRLQKNIPFQQWRQSLEKREKLQRALKLRMRIEEARERERNAANRSSISRRVVVKATVTGY